MKEQQKTNNIYSASNSIYILFLKYYQATIFRVSIYPQYLNIKLLNISFVIKNILYISPGK